MSIFRFTNQGPQHLALQRAAAAVCLCLVTLLGGCEPTEKPPAVAAARYETLPPKEVPQVLKGTILAIVDAQGTDGSPISAYGLVVNLPGTGDTTAPQPVREYLLKDMARHGFGRSGAASSGYDNAAAMLSPDEVINNNPGKKVAIVRVDAIVPPGIRRHQRYDVVVSALPDSTVLNLSGGRLYPTGLKIEGADPRAPQAHIQELGVAQGFIFSNPSVALNPRTVVDDPQLSRLSRRQGLILDGGVSTVDRPIILRLRSPQRSVSRSIQVRLNERFQTEPSAVAAAKDEGLIELTVPESFNGDWEHFLGVCMNTYMSRSPDLVASKSKQLAEEALKPDAPLLNISYAWESMGTAALPALTPLLSPKYPQDICFAAARAGAFIGDSGAIEALIQMAQAPNHQFQVDAIRTLGQLSINSGMASNALTKVAYGAEPGSYQPVATASQDAAGRVGNTVARVEAYRVLADRGSRAVISRTVGDRFFLDAVPAGRPLIYATRSGRPRLAIFGDVGISTPLTFTGLDQELSLSCQAAGLPIDLYYRGRNARSVVSIQVRPRAAELALILGGVLGDDTSGMALTYSEIVAIMQSLSDKGLLIGPDGQKVPFVLQDVRTVRDEVENAPPLPGQGRPTGDTIPQLGSHLPTTLPTAPSPETPPKPDGRPSGRP